MKLEKDILKKEYPLLWTLFGDVFDIDLITCTGFGNAHMIFAPSLERALRAKAESGVWDLFEVQIRLKKKKQSRKKRPSTFTTTQGDKE